MLKVAPLGLVAHRQRKPERVLLAKTAELRLEPKLHAQSEGELLIFDLHGPARRDGRERRAGAWKKAVFESATNILFVCVFYVSVCGVCY